MDRAEIVTLGRSVIRDDLRALESVEADLGDGFLAAVELLQGSSGSILVTGMGTSGATARRIAHMLACGGAGAHFVHPADALHGGLGAVRPGDVVIALSRGGESDEVNQFCRLAQARGARVIAMTREADSTLAQLSDCILPVRTAPDSDPGGLMAGGSSIAASAIGDALAVVLMRLRGYTFEDFEDSHPGGSVGKHTAATQGPR